jgi:phosphonate transport system substrate-binding protein
MLLKNNLCIFFGIFLISTMFVSNASAQETTIPDWIKNNAGWWADGLIDDNSFVSGMQWLISNGIIILESEVDNQDPDEEGRVAGGVLTGQN